MIVERTMNPEWLSNSWLIADREGGHAVVIDTGGPWEPIAALLEERRLELTHVLCTHHHYDHVLHNGAYAERYGCPVCGHAAERERFEHLDLELADGDELRVGDLRVRALHIPGHTEGQLAFVINDTHVATGDTLFAGSVGGTRAPGHGTFDQLQHSLIDVLMKLPKETQVLPGHCEETTIGAEWESNPFLLAFTGREAPRPARCTALGQPAELLLRARDYDGGGKCWVRFDDGRVDVVAGSKVTSGA